MSTTIELAIFDLAGTTIDDRDEVYRVLREAAEREGAVLSPEQFQENMGLEKRHALGELIQVGTDLSGEEWEKARDRAWRWFRTELARTYRDHPPAALAGIPEMLHELAESGIKIGFTTGFSRDIVDIIFNSLEWHPDISVAGDEVSKGRPAPDLIQATMSQAGITDPRRVVNFGDTAADIRSAQAAGVYAVGVLTGHLSMAEFQQLKADAIVGSAADAGELIAKI